MSLVSLNEKIAWKLVKVTGISLNTFDYVGLPTRKNVLHF